MTEGMSLGWNCDSAGYGVTHNIRTRKENGYGTCVFDLMCSNYKGMIEAIRDDFKYLCDLEYIELIKIPKESKWMNTNGDGDVMIYNSKYKFIYVHESPGHGNVYYYEKWEKGMHHFVMNQFEELIIRYQRRIQNTLNLLNSGNHITFILSRPNTTFYDLNELNDMLVEKYPALSYNIIILDPDKELVYDHLILMGLDEDDPEVKRLKN